MPRLLRLVESQVLKLNRETISPITERLINGEYIPDVADWAALAVLGDAVDIAIAFVPGFAVVDALNEPFAPDPTTPGVTAAGPATLVSDGIACLGGFLEFVVPGFKGETPTDAGTAEAPAPGVGESRPKGSGALGFSSSYCIKACKLTEAYKSCISSCTAPCGASGAANSSVGAADGEVPDGTLVGRFLPAMD